MGVKKRVKKRLKNLLFFRKCVLTPAFFQNPAVFASKSPFFVQAVTFPQKLLHLHTLARAIWKEEMALKKIIPFILFFLLKLFVSGEVFGQGLKFSGMNEPINDRTSYDVFSMTSPDFRNRLEISFDLALYPESAIGYILRIKDVENDKVFNLFYDGQGDVYSFSLNNEGYSNLLGFSINQETVNDQRWIPVDILFDMQRDSVTMTVAGYSYSAPVHDLPDKWSPEINFGKSDFIIDVPSFAIRNLNVRDVRKSYAFPLTEREGESVHDSKGRIAGRVTNPEWLMNDFFDWRRLCTLSSETAASSVYNPVRKEVYYFNRDTLYIYDTRLKQVSEFPFRDRCPVKMTLGTSFIDPANNFVYAYEVWYEHEADSGRTTVARLDLNTLTWKSLSTEQLPMQMHHHGSFFDQARARYVIFGGFGNMHYNGDFYAFNLQTGHWTQYSQTEGDRICPRYFSSMGYDRDNSTFYVYGGMGNDSGEQAVGRRYLYDMYAVNVADRKVRKLWETDLHAGNVVPVRNMYIDGNGYFYTLCYPESTSKSALTLYKISIEDGSYTTIGNTIPITSDRIITNANIYYDRGMEKLYALVYETDDDISSTLTVYSLSLLSAREAGGSEFVSRGGQKYGLIAAIAAVLLLSCAAVILRKKTRPEKPCEEQEDIPEQKSVIPNSVCLFGGFTAVDREGKDITASFTPTQKKMFCVVLYFSSSGGVTPSRLTASLWPDKQKESAKSLRNATINHLRKSLSGIDGIRFVYDDGVYRIDTDPVFYCDYLHFTEIVSSESYTDADTEDLIRILGRGKFLEYTDDPVFDILKSNVEQTLSVILPPKVKSLYHTRKYEYVLSLCNIILCLDQLNELALRYTVMTLCHLGRTDDAAVKYAAFKAEYQKVYSEDYPHKFEELSENPDQQKPEK